MRRSSSEGADEGDTGLELFDVFRRGEEGKDGGSEEVGDDIVRGGSGEEACAIVGDVSNSCSRSNAPSASTARFRIAARVLPRSGTRA